MAEILQEKFMGSKSRVIKEVSKPTNGDKPYQLIQNYDEYEVTTTVGKKTEERNKRLSTKTIKTETYDKPVEVEKREEQKPSKRKAKKVEFNRSVSKDQE